MERPILEINGLGKEYRLRGHTEPYKNLRDSLVNIFSKKKPINQDTFWALKDIDLQINEGESIGIIGSNGAGKSTLLKILSKITYPTEGEIIARGRVASLLEVGTGFHPELSGRENIYLNGSILGLSRKEIESQFDAIVDFSGVEKFLDTSLKHYSSGMQLRLAFAVAAHLEPEILIIDEVLAVGDHEFQQKCLTKMKDVSRQGRTVIFVSHNMNALINLCTRGVLLEKGKKIMEGDISNVVTSYMDRNQDRKSQFLFTGIIQEVNITNTENSPEIFYMDVLQVKVKFNIDTPLDFPVLGIVIRDEMGTALLGINNRHYLTENLVSSPVKSGEFNVGIGSLNLVPGNYMIDVFLGDRNVDVSTVENQMQFKIAERPITPTKHDINKALNRIFPKDVSWDITPLP